MYETPLVHTEAGASVRVHWLLINQKTSKKKESSLTATANSHFLFLGYFLPTWLHFVPTISVSSLQTTSSCRLFYAPHVAKQRKKSDRKSNKNKSMPMPTKRRLQQKRLNIITPIRNIIRMLIKPLNSHKLIILFQNLHHIQLIRNINLFMFMMMTM